MQQRNRPSSQLIIGILVAVLFIGKSMAQENTDWKDRFFAEAPKRWEDYVRFARSLQVTLISHQSGGADRSPEEGDARQVYKQTKGSCLRVDQDLGPKGEATAEGTNSSYSFKLKRRSPDRGWIITDLVVSDQSAFSDVQRRLQERHLHNVCDCLRLDTHLWLPTLIHDQDFRITAIKPQEIDGHLVVRFDFDYPKPAKDYPVKGTLRVKGGWMVLDPEHDWILREYLVHFGQPEKYFIHETYHIREGTDRHPIITDLTYQVVGKGEKPFESIMKMQLQTEERSDVPLEEFTLSAFGLPEPPGINVERSRLYLWIALGGIACLGIAALIRWLSQRAAVAG
jgi:hypothetical protein